jgi:LemA protein
MEPHWILLGIVVAILLLLALYLAFTYNRLVTLRERFKNAYSQIDVQLKRRHDLIPNLVETVKGYMSHERQTLEAVIQARNQAAAAGRQAAAHPTDTSAIRGIVGAESMLVAALGQFMMLREAYPQLKADQQTARLMEELASAENRIAFARQHYNDSVMAYNAYRQSFPQVLVAGPAGFGEAVLFEINVPSEREAQQVHFDRPAPAPGAAQA